MAWLVWVSCQSLLHIDAYGGRGPSLPGHSQGTWSLWVVYFLTPGTLQDLVFHFTLNILYLKKLPSKLVGFISEEIATQPSVAFEGSIHNHRILISVSLVEYISQVCLGSRGQGERNRTLQCTLQTPGFSLLLVNYKGHPWKKNEYAIFKMIRVTLLIVSMSYSGWTLLSALETQKAFVLFIMEELILSSW